MTAPVEPPSWQAAPPLETLPRGGCHVFAIEIPGADAPDHLLAPTERERGNQFLRTEDRRRYVVTRLALRRILGALHHIDPAEVVFGYGPAGKPQLVAPGARPEWRFNVSGSHNMALIAIREGHDIGVDLEVVRAFPDALSIAQRFFAAAEHQWLASLPNGERDAAFVERWTRKEAMIKAHGLGLADLAAVPGLSVDPTVTVERFDAPWPMWCLRLAPPARGYVAALAGSGEVAPVHCWRWWPEGHGS